jgi:hypothetical protein
MDSQMKKYFKHYHYLGSWKNLLPFVLLLAMVAAFLLLDAMLPLRSFWFRDALLTHLGTWPVFLTRLLFPHRSIMPALPSAITVKPTLPPGTWGDTALLVADFLIIFLFYLLALRLLPQRIGLRYIVASTLLLGMLCAIVPIVISSDVFSYIVYARLGVIYHLNPLTSLPSAIRNDQVYHYLSWRYQPSVYGPFWTLITSFAQWLLVSSGHKSLVLMVLALRFVALASHLGSTWLIWSITGHLARHYGFISIEKRVTATLAFAWNPLLLFEAGVNAHNDATLLVCILLAIWLLVRSPQRTTLDYMLAAVVFALAMCIKLNVIVLAPGLLLFLWMQPQKVRTIALTMATCLGTFLLLYAPFWQNGEVFRVLAVTPAPYRNVNSLPEFVSYLYIGIYQNMTDPTNQRPVPVSVASAAGHFTHLLSIAIFLVLTGVLWWRASRSRSRIDNVPELTRWLALAWLIYCAFGATWFWTWYAVTFFGLYAIFEVTCNRKSWGLLHPFGVRLFIFSLLTVYCFITWKPSHTDIPGLPYFLWAYIRGVWIWTVPLLALLTIQLQLRLSSFVQKLSILAFPSMKRA